MITGWGDNVSEKIWNGTRTKAALRTLPVNLWKVAQRKMDLLHAAAELKDLRVPPANHLEALKGDLKGFHSIRISDQYRIVFRWSPGAASDVQVIDYH